VKLTFTQPHTVDLVTLKAHAQQRLTHYAERYPHLGLAEHFRWVTDRSVSGSYKGGSGTLSVDEREIRVALEVPFFARPFRGRIEDFVRRELDLAAAAT
jgi:hypothetical protein